PKSSGSVSVRLEMYPLPLQAKILAELYPSANITLQDLEGQPPPPTAPGAPGMSPSPSGPPGQPALGPSPMQGGPPLQLPPPGGIDQPPGAQASMAAIGKSPFRPNA